MTDIARSTHSAFFGLAVCDALGAPLEFQPRRKLGSYICDMLPNTNFGLPAGHFTDDTSMALCLAASLTRSPVSPPQPSTLSDLHDPTDQAARYFRWLDHGYMSSSNTAFDIGTQTRQALQYWRPDPSAIRTQPFIIEKFNESWRCGNGSLMRVLPCALVAVSETEAVELARRSSEVTHPHVRCVDACAIYALFVWHAMRGAGKEELVGRMQEWLQRPASMDETLRTRLWLYDCVAAFLAKPRKLISSSGYVLDSLEAALWAFFTTESFEQGAVEVVNLGDDADTVGAIYGGLAGAWYGDGCIPQRWLDKMRSWHLVEEAVEKMSNFYVDRLRAHDGARTREGTGSGGPDIG